MSKQAFIEMMMPHAVAASQRTGVDPRIIVAQAALESAWGRKAPGNNYFGIKSHGKGGGQTFATTEVINGRRVKMRDSFRQYGSPGESVQGYADFLLNNPRYKPMREAQGIDAQIAALGRSGYATDPAYASKIASIASGVPYSGGSPVTISAQPTSQAPRPPGATPASAPASPGSVPTQAPPSTALPFGLSPPTDTAVAPEATPDQPKGTNWGTMLAMMAEPSAPPPELAPMQPVQTAQPAVPDILQALRQQRYTKAPMPFGLFPGA